MKRSVLTALFLLAGALCLQAETIKLKSGRLVSGSIISQTEYTLNLATSYGTVTLNQREIEQILPDKYRVFLKGGTQLVGTVLDLDEFNLKLQTDDGTVNIDMPQIVSMEVYDYDQGTEQKQYVEEKIEQEQAAQAAAQAAAAAAAAGIPLDTSVPAAGGLSFDSDIDKVFDTKKAEVVGGQVITPAAPSVTETAAPRPMTDEEAFIKGVKTGAVSQQDFAAAAKQELAAKKPAKKKEEPKKYSEHNLDKYFAVEVGAMPLDLKLNNSQRAGYSEGDNYDVGGTSAVAAAKFLWRVKDSNFWLGPTFSIANISNNSFDDKDPAVLAANQQAEADGKTLPYPDPKVKTSGQILNLSVTANYYINPQNRFAFYLTANAGYEMLTLNYRGEAQSDTIKSNGFSYSGGAGVETRIDDVLVGLEVRQHFADRSDELKDSASSNTVALIKLSWKF